MGFEDRISNPQQGTELQSAEGSAKSLSLMGLAVHISPAGSMKADCEVAAQAGLPIRDASDLPGVPRPTLTQKTELLASDENALVRGVKNAGSVYAQLLPSIPAAIAAQLKSDCCDNSASTLLKFGEAAAIGLAASVALARSPVFAKALLGVAGIGSSALGACLFIPFS